MDWFNFSLRDFSYAFLSVLLEGIPFLLLGTLLSGLIDEFLPSRTMTRFLPRNTFLGICLSAAMGLVFPMCECGIVPVIRRLIAKGLPVSNAVAYMLAAPVVNPIVAVSTYAAFRGQGAVEFTLLRMGLAFLVAVIVALAVHNLPLPSVLKPGILDPEKEKDDHCCGHGPCGHDHHHDHHHDHGDHGGHGGHDHGPHVAPGFGRRIAAALGTGIGDFLDVAVYFVLGVAVSSTFSTSVNSEVILPLALNDWLAVASMMGLAAVLSLCSTSDAFIAASFVAFPGFAKLAFLVFGPMMDFKLLFIYGAVFKKRFIAGLAVGLFVLIGLLCVRLSFLGL